MLKQNSKQMRFLYQVFSSLKLGFSIHKQIFVINCNAICFCLWGCVSVCLCVCVSVRLCVRVSVSQCFSFSQTDTNCITINNKLSTFVWKIQDLKKKNLIQKPHLLRILFQQWLFQGEFWKDNFKGFSNLALKIAYII